MHNQLGNVITGKKNEVAPISFSNTLERETKYVSRGGRRKKFIHTPS